ncbi:MAG TPA: hypothetical protein VFA12_11890 [Stellaceae bacterium]|nr:hypothetical protein [Stellaceae bacterium]
MISATSRSAIDIVTALATASAAWPDELWAGSVGWIDGLLRSYYGIYEFTDDPDCVFRIGTTEAKSRVLLADGARIEPGEVVGTLHFWNEQLPRYSESGPDLRWARAMRDRVQYSLCVLADYLEREPGWRNIRALYGEATLTARLGTAQVLRVAERYGFEPMPRQEGYLGRLHTLGENIMLWGLTRAFHPAALPRLPFRRDYNDLWMSRTTLRQRYAQAPRKLNYRVPQPQSA